MNGREISRIDPSALYSLIKNSESSFLECKIASPRYYELAEYAELLGSGISFLLDQLRVKGKPDPEFMEQKEFIITLP